MNSVTRMFLTALLMTFTLASAQEVRNGESLLKAMHDRYPSWYRTLTFNQKSITFNPDGTSKTDIWYEAAILPGKLRIDFGPPSNGNGAILVDGKVTLFRDGKETGTRDSVNMLLVLGFDVYAQAPEATTKVVKGEGYDLTKLHEDTWDGHPAYVVGADKGDLNAKQFWVEKDTLLFVRVIEPSQGDATKFDDIRFADYRKVDGGWVAARVEVYSEGKKVFMEEYSDIQVNPKLNANVFDPKQFSSTHWEKQ